MFSLPGLTRLRGGGGGRREAARRGGQEGRRACCRTPRPIAGLVLGARRHAAAHGKLESGPARSPAGSPAGGPAGPWERARVRQFAGGWRAVHDPEHGREYYWHQASGQTTWQAPPIAELSATSSPVSSSPSRDGAARARELPDGWVAVFSSEHGCEYFWHRPSGRVTWEVPSLQALGMAGDAKEGDESYAFQGVLSERLVLAPASEDDGASLREARRLASTILRSYEARERLGPHDFGLMLELLGHHPDTEAKVGSGVQAIFVDESLHESGAPCFWVLRTDGSSEDFSARRCFEAAMAALPTRGRGQR